MVRYERIETAFVTGRHALEMPALAQVVSVEKTIAGRLSLLICYDESNHTPRNREFELLSSPVSVNDRMAYVGRVGDYVLFEVV